MIRGIAGVALVLALFAVPAGGGPIRVSFLNSTDAQEDTIQRLKEAGCPWRTLDIFRRALGQYYSAPFNVSTFPLCTAGSRPTSVACAAWPRGTRQPMRRRGSNSS